MYYIDFTFKEYNTTDISWSDSTGNTSWLVRYKPVSDETWQEQTVNTTGTSLSGLAHGTRYEVRVYALCSDGSFSDVLSGNFITKRKVPYLETFSYESCIPDDWSYYTGNLGTTSTLDSATPEPWDWYCPTISSSYTTAMDQHLRGNIHGDAPGRWIVSPTIHLTEDAQVEMDIICSSNAEGTEEPAFGTDDKFAVVLSLDNGATWSIQNAIIWSVDTAGNNHNYLGTFNTTKKHVVIPLENTSGVSYINMGVKIALYFESPQLNEDNYVHIDNFAINARQWCLTPMGLTLAGVPH